MICAWEHEGMAMLLLQEAMASRNDPARLTDKLTDAFDHLQAAQYHVAAKSPEIAERLRTFKKKIQRTQFHNSLLVRSRTQLDEKAEAEWLEIITSELPSDLKELQEIRSMTHALFPEAASAEEAHKKSHGECEGCGEIKTFVPARTELSQPETSHAVRGLVTWQGPVPADIARFKEIELHNPIEPSPKLFSSKKPNLTTSRFKNTARDEKLVHFMGKEVAVVTGFSFLGKVLERGFVEVDKATKLQTKPPHERPSTWINVGLGIGTVLVGGFGVLGSPWDIGAAVWGAHHLTKLVDYAEEYAGIPTGETGEIGGGPVFQRQVYPPAQQAPPVPGFPARLPTIIA